MSVMQCTGGLIHRQVVCRADKGLCSGEADWSSSATLLWPVALQVCWAADRGYGQCIQCAEACLPGKPVQTLARKQADSYGFRPEGSALLSGYQLTGRTHLG